jgi:hypothetical protein
VIEALASLGVFVAVPLTGRRALGRLGSPIPAIARASLWISAGVALWSVPLLVSLMLAVYRPELLGVAGWLTVVLFVIRRRPSMPRAPRLTPTDLVVLIGLTGAALLIAAYPADPFATGWDMGTYANHAVYMVNHGRLDVPYPWPAGESAPPGFWPPGNIFATEPAMTVRFANLWPAWLAQTWAATGYEGLVRLNVVVGFLALLAIYGLARRFVDPRVAALAVLFLAFNPAQVWVTRQTLSEVPTQLLIWAALLLLTASLWRGQRHWALWAGLLVGLAAFVRVDAFLLLPLVLMAHALHNIIGPEGALRRAPRWQDFYMGALPVFAMALAYYAIFSQPYLIELTRQMLMIAMLAAVGAIALIVSRWPRVVALARVVLAQRVVVLGLLAALAVLTAYAHFVRPALPPFARFDAPGFFFDGMRTHFEDALPNLGLYLTPAVVWGALLGWSAVFVAAIRRPRRTILVPLLVVALGCTAVYVWNQAVWPYHFWAIRRFIPVIIPALLIFAAVAGSITLSRLPALGRRIALAAGASLLATYTLWIGLPTYTVAERQGTYVALAEFAPMLPRTGQILAVDGIYEAQHYWMPLYLAFDRPIVQVDPATEAGRAQALAMLADASSANPVPLITSAHDFRMDSIEGRRTVTTSWSGTVITETVDPVPRSTRTETVTLTFIKATGVNTLGVAFGGTREWVAAASGFHAPQVIDGTSLRWTDGHGRLSIPVLGSDDPSTLTITLADTGPDGADLRVVLNGVTLFDGSVQPGPWTAEYELDGRVHLSVGDTIEVEIISSVFQSDAIGEDEQRTLGVLVEAVTLVADGP